MIFFTSSSRYQAQPFGIINDLCRKYCPHTTPSENTIPIKDQNDSITKLIVESGRLYAALLIGKNGGFGEGAETLLMKNLIKAGRKIQKAFGSKSNAWGGLRPNARQEASEYCGRLRAEVDMIYEKWAESHGKK